MTETSVTGTFNGIDSQGLDSLAAKNIEQPEHGHKVVKSKTVLDSGFRNYNYVRDHEGYLISEPHKLLGDDEAPNPTEIALGALGSCVSVGLVANATKRGVKLTKVEVELEGRIDISAAWGVGDLAEDKVLGVSHVDMHVYLDGDADEETLQAITDSAIKWSPVVNTFSRPATFETSLKVGAGHAEADGDASSHG
ncbi:OsmC family protein [Nesterenkonia populi]|uniref:OsmC family protein n=1 Tax=Nesterenkonia populi TaxID=1591087 RepID=UPI0011BF3DAA|nr:OsmC family protein [Nesterenkonia populi]